MKKIKTELGEIELGKPANVINNTSDVIKILGQNFSGASRHWLETIAKNMPDKDLKKAFPIYNTLKDSDLIEMDDNFNWTFKKEI